MGPLVTGEHLARVPLLRRQRAGEGAALLDDGRTVKVEGRPAGFFLGPSLFDHVKPGMKLYERRDLRTRALRRPPETFDEAIALVNQNHRANGVAVFTRDGGAARKFQNEIQVGMVGINVPIPVPMAFYSFGGWKDSLFGDMSVHGRKACASTRGPRW